VSLSLLHWLNWWQSALSAEHNICRLPPDFQLVETQSRGLWYHLVPTSGDLTLHMALGLMSHMLRAGA